jgi:hypothetical protein
MADTVVYIAVRILAGIVLLLLLAACPLAWFNRHMFGTRAGMQVAKPHRNSRGGEALGNGSSGHAVPFWLHRRPH